MKKKLVSLSFLILSFVATAQEKEVTSDKPDFNRWSIEVGAGVNKPLRGFTAGNYTSTPSFWNADLGARYMINPKFGFKLDLGYNKFQDGKGSQPFDTDYFRTDLQAVVNLGRVLNFETWTNTIGLLAHGGVGVSMMKSDAFNGEDFIANGIVGLTGQIKLSNSVVLTGDVSAIANGLQDKSFDGKSNVPSRFFDSAVLNASVGFTFYLGNKEKHADWVADTDKYDELEQRVSVIETGIVDSDKDGVADLYDLEPNTAEGAIVNTKGQSVDANKNGVPDQLESYLENNYVQKGGNTSATNNTVEELINGGYVNTYFDFNSSKPTNASLSGVDFLVKYLKNNPSKSADVIGYADEVGSTGYNQTLSRKRAEAVKNVLVNAGIDASRLNVVANGEDTSVNKNSQEARQIVRRVTFKVK